MYRFGLSNDWRKGFSLVELLVVIAIVGILISLVYVNFTEARKNTRDKLRKTTLTDLQLAIERYKAQNNKYPLGACGNPPADTTNWVTPDLSNALVSGAGAPKDCKNFIRGLVPQYIPALPSPSQPSGVGYYYQSDGYSYKVVVYNAVESTSQLITSDDDNFSVCPSQCPDSAGLCSGVDNNSYAVYSPGGACL